MRRFIPLCLGLLLAMVSPMFAAPASQLVLNAGSVTCIIDVSTTGVVTSTPSCSPLSTISYNTTTQTLSVVGTLNHYVINEAATGGENPQDLTQQLQKKSAGAGTFSASFTANNYTPASPTFAVATSWNNLTSAASSVVFTGAVGSNTIPATTPFIIPPITLTGTSANFTGSYANPLAFTSPYSITQNKVVSFTKAGTISAGFQVGQAVPEPAAISVLGGALLFACARLRRKPQRA